VLLAASIGIRAGADQESPSCDVEKTMSFELHLTRNRQSSQATYTVPSPPISALGSGLVRRLPATPWKRIPATLTACDQLAPPFVDTNDEIAPFRLSNGTTTVPFGWTTGCPPRPLSCPAVSIGTDQVTPPSLEVLMYSTSPCPKLSNSV
jgi:hypothetical protein